MLQIRDPKASFTSLAAADIEATGLPGLWPPVSRLVLWGLAAGLLDSLAIFARLRPAPQSLLLDVISVLLFPVFAVGLTALTSGLYHVACQMVGGKAPWRASFRTLASMAWTAPLDVLALAFAPVAVLLAFYRLFLLSEAARVLHGLSRTRAIAAAVILGAGSFLIVATAATGLAVLSASVKG